jgi:hypothetical protein
VKRAAAVKKRKILAIKLNRKKKVFKKEDPVEIITTPRLSKINAINSITTHNQPASSAVFEDNKKNKPVNNNNEDANNGSSSTSENIILVPSYRQKVFTPLYRIEGTEVSVLTDYNENIS